MSTHPSGLFRENVWNVFYNEMYFSPYGWWPLKFLHALQIDQGSLSHIPNWAGSPLQNFKGEDFKTGLKIQHKIVPKSAYNFGTSGNNPRKL